MRKLKSILGWVSVIAIVGTLLYMSNYNDRNNTRKFRQQKLEQSKKYDVSLGDDVYICTGENSHAYHSYEDCEGLSYCKDEIQTITYQEAVRDYDRTPCHYCVQQ